MPRLAAFWFVYMSGLGLVFPFQTLYFIENVGLTGTQVGLVLGARPMMGILSQTIWGQLAEPGDVAELAVYLGSEESTGMTGQSILLDGGMVLV